MTKALSIAIVLLVGLVGSLVSSAPAFAQDEVTISMTVVVRTKGAPVPHSFDVSVDQVDEDGSPVASTSTVVPADGKGSVRFSDLAGAIYVASVTYDDIEYRSAAQPSEAGLAVELNVYEATNDPSVISVQLDTLTVVRGAKDTLEVFQLMRIENTGDRTFIGEDSSDRKSVLRLAIPQGAYDFLRGQGLIGELSESGADAVTSDPVLPGISSINFLYKVDVPRTGWSLSKEILYPTEIFDVLIGTGLTFSGPGFTFQETVDLESQTYRRFRAPAARPGGTKVGNIGFEPRASGIAPGLIGAIVVFVAVAIGVPVYLRKRGKGDGVIDRESLVEEIAALDETFENGSLEEAAYRSERSSLKKRLDGITKDIGAR